MNRETKTIRAQLKQAGEAGEFEAVIATLGVVDSDGDIIEPGAFKNATVPLVPSHEQWHVPLGKVRIEERGNEAVAVGKFNLEVSAARDWHAAIKFDLENPPATQEWSFGYFPKEADGKNPRHLITLDTIEVSPVIRGSGVNTRTLAAKALKVHKTETSDAPWDLVANLRRLKSGDSGDWLHHFIDEGGEETAASTRACLLGIARLNGAFGRTGMKRSEVEATHAHLAAHLKDAGVEPPELRAESDPPSLRAVDQVKFARWGVESALERLRDLSAERQKDGRKVGAGVQDEVALLAAECAKLGKTLETVSAAMKACGPDDAVSRAVTEWAIAQARLTSRQAPA